MSLSNESLGLNPDNLQANRIARRTKVARASEESWFELWRYSARATKGNNIYLRPSTCYTKPRHSYFKIPSIESLSSNAYSLPTITMPRTPGQHLSAPQIGPSNPLSDPSPVLQPLTTHEYNSPSPVPHNSCDISGESEDMDGGDDEDNEHAEDDEDDEDNIGPDCYATGPLSREKKLGVIIKALRRTKWSFEDMIEAWVGVNGPQDVRVQHRRYHKQKQRRSAMTRVMRSLAERGICQEVSIDVRCASELDVLVSRAPFSKFAVDMTLESLDDAQAASVIKEVAPTWHSLLQVLLSNRRHHRATYGARNNHTTIQRRMFAITSIVCFSRARKASNTLSSCLDIYLMGSGVHRRVIETLQGLGLCHSYHHANTLMSQVAKHASVRAL